jgi:hypothetical protein
MQEQWRTSRTLDRGGRRPLGTWENSRVPNASTASALPYVIPIIEKCVYICTCTHMYILCEVFPILLEEAGFGDSIILGLAYSWSSMVHDGGLGLGGGSLGYCPSPQLSILLEEAIFGDSKLVWLSLHSRSSIRMEDWGWVVGPLGSFLPQRQLCCLVIVARLESNTATE